MQDQAGTHKHELDSHKDVSVLVACDLNERGVLYKLGPSSCWDTYSLSQESEKLREDSEESERISGPGTASGQWSKPTNKGQYVWATKWLLLYFYLPNL